MKRHLWVLPVAALALGVFVLAAARARDDDEKEKMEAAKKAGPDVAKAADAVGKPEELKKAADAIAKKYDELAPIMWQMKPADKNGQSILKPPTYANDSIELGLLQLGKKPPSGDALKTQGPDIVKASQFTRAIAEIAPKYAKKYAKTPADEKAWNDMCADMAKGSDDLIAASQKADATAFKKAINDLNHSCNSCHEKFRDN